MRWPLWVAVLVVGCGPKISSPHGGVRMTLRADLSGIAVADHAKTISNTLKAIEGRIGGLTQEEFSVRPVGRDEFRLEIAGKTSLAEVRKALLATVEARFCWARNLQTAKISARPYKEEPPAKGGDPYTFLSARDFKPVDASLVIKDWVTVVNSIEIEAAGPTNLNGKWLPAFRFTAPGGSKMKAWCLANASKGESLALVINGEAYSVAPLQSGALIERDAVIQNGGTVAQVRALVAKVNAARLPVKLIEVDAQEFRP